MGVSYRNYYEILGVKRDATGDQIRKAYRKLAKQYHPDVNKDPGAEAKYKEINEAYEVLKDAEKRSRYDTLGEDWKAGQDFQPPPGWAYRGNAQEGDGNAWGDFSDFFRVIFGAQGSPGAHGSRGSQGQEAPDLGDFLFRSGARRQAAPSVEVELTLSLQEVLLGGAKSITLEAQEPDANGQIVPRRRKISVNLPQGVTEGSRIRLAGKGPGGADLYVTIHLHADGYAVEGHNLRTSVKIAPWEAALGGVIPVRTPGGKVSMRLPEGTQGGQTFRLKEKGLPRRKGASPGDLFVAVEISVPRTLTPRERELFEALAAESSFSARPAEETSRAT